jgi:integrase
MGAFHCLTDPKDGKTYWVMVVREETAKGRKERTLPVTKAVMAALGSYREAFGMDARPAPSETCSIIPLSRLAQRAAPFCPLVSATAIWLGAPM